MKKNLNAFIDILLKLKHILEKNKCILIILIDAFRYIEERPY